MFNQHRAILLGLIVVQGVNLVASESNIASEPNKKSGLSNSGKNALIFEKAALEALKNQQKNLLSRSTEGCSTQARKEAKLLEEAKLIVEEKKRNNSSGSAGCLQFVNDVKHATQNSLIPYDRNYWEDYPGAGYKPYINFK